eukprot:5096466-Prymnesium_polylepis.1
MARQRCARPVSAGSPCVSGAVMRRRTGQCSCLATTPAFYADAPATAEAELSRGCYRAAFGDVVNMTAVSMPMRSRARNSSMP